MRHFVFFVFLAVSGLLAASSQAEILLITHTGNVHPGSEGASVMKFDKLHINDSGDLSYLGRYDHFSDFDDPSEVDVLQRPVLGGSAYLASEHLHQYESLDLSFSDEVVYETSEGIYRNMPSVQPSVPFHPAPGQVIAENGGSPADRNVTYGRFYDFSARPRINDSGVVAFRAGLEDRNGQGLFRSSGLSAFVVALAEDAAPGTNAQFHRFDEQVINANRQIAAIATLQGASVDSTNNTAIYLFDQPQPGQTVHLIARKGQTVASRPDHHFSELRYSDPGISDAGEVFFAAEMQDSLGQSSSGLFRYHQGVLEDLLVTGDPLPDGSGDVYQVFGGTPEKAGDHLLFLALVGDPVVPSDALFLRDSSGQTEMITQEGRDVPNGDGRFSHINAMGVNSRGEVAFKAGLLGASEPNIIDDSGPNEAIYFRNQQGQLTEIIREGRDFLGHRVERLFMADEVLDDEGRVAFTFQLNIPGGFEAVAVWSEGTINHVDNGHFEDRTSGLAGWATTSSGSGSVSATTSSSGDTRAQLVTGSPVSIEQMVNTPAAPLEIHFDFQFVDGTGQLTVLLNESELAVLDGDDFGPMEHMQSHILRPDGRTGLLDVPLTFRYDSENAGQALLLDDISLRVVPEPASMVFLAAGSLLVFGKRRRPGR
jgi:hypothetical protein